MEEHQSRKLLFSLKLQSKYGLKFQLKAWNICGLAETATNSNVKGGNQSI